MAELYKIHEKNKSLFATVQSDATVYEAPTGAQVLPVLTVDGSITTETGSYAYLGDSLSRDEYSYIQDQYAEFTSETPLQILGTLDAGRTVDQVPMHQFFRSCGGAIRIQTTGTTVHPAGTVFIDNSTSSDSKLAIDLRYSSSQDGTNQKLRKFYSCQGTVDLQANLGDVPKCIFNMKGNASNPVQAPILTPSFGSQFENVISSVQQNTIVRAKIAARSDAYTTFSSPAIAGLTNGVGTLNIASITFASSHGLGEVGDIRFLQISGATDPLYNGTFMGTIRSTDKIDYVMNGVPAANASGTFVLKVGPPSKAFCFSSLNAPNFFGFEQNRYKTGCESGFNKTAVPTDVTVSMLEGKAPAITVTGITSTTTTATITAPGHGIAPSSTASITVSEVTGGGASFYNITATATATNTNHLEMPIASYNGSFSGTARLVNNDATYFDPDSNINKFFGLVIKLGTGEGRYATYKWDKLQIQNVSEGTVDGFLGREIAFRNTGRSFLVLN